MEEFRPSARLTAVGRELKAAMQPVEKSVEIATGRPRATITEIVVVFLLTQDVVPIYNRTTCGSM